MSTLFELHDYSPIGNTLEEMNRNFHLMNNRVCVLQESMNRWQNFTDTINTLKPKLNNQVKFLDRNAQRYTDMSNIVFNAQEFWKEPITIVYSEGFSVVGNYIEAQKWLNSNFPASQFIDNQRIRLEFLIKTYDPAIMDNYPINELAYNSLTSMANSYGLKLKDIMDYIVVDNQCQTVINAINAIFVRMKKPDLILDSTEKIQLIYSDIVFKNNAYTATLLADFDDIDLQLIYCLFDQYFTIFLPKRTSLLNIPTVLPADILERYDNKLIYTNFVYHFTFVKNGSTWAYIPNTLESIPQITNCNSCYDYIDLDKIYKDRNCEYRAVYELIECEMPNASYGETQIP